MAWYKLCNNGEPRAADYVFSIKSKDDPMFLALKENLKRHNKDVRARLRSEDRQPDGRYPYMSLMRARVMSRGPRAIYSNLDHGHSYAYDSFLPHKYASYFDVYVGSDSHNNYYLRQEIDTGLTRKEMDKIQDLESEKNKIKSKAIWAARAKEIEDALKDDLGLTYHEYASLQLEDKVPADLYDRVCEIVGVLSDMSNNTYMTLNGTIVPQRSTYFETSNKLREKLKNV